MRSHPDRRLLLTGALIIGSLILGAVLFLVSPTLRELATSPQLLRDRIQSFGWWAPAVVISYHVLQVIFAPIPGQAVDVANGFVFGPWLGPLYSMMGIGLGTTLATWLARRFGRPLVRHLLGERAITIIDRYTGRQSLKYFFMLFLLPGMPDDILCFALGLTRIPIQRGVLIAIIGRTPGVVGAVLLGATGRGLTPVQFLGLVGAVVLLWAVVAWVFRNRLARIDKAASNW